MIKGIITRINNTQLTRSERIVGDFIVDHWEKACFMTSTELSKQLSVSDATIIRFSRKLGYGGFSDFQKNLRAAQQDEHRRISHSITVPYERLHKSLEYGADEYTQLLAISSQESIGSALAKNPPELFSQAADAIVASQNKYIIASRANAGLGQYMYFLMKCMLPGVQSLYAPGASEIDNLSDIGKDDCVIVFSFPRYSKSDIMLCDIAWDAGAKIILVTDKNSAPICPQAELVFVADVDSHNFFNSFVGVQFVLEAICSGVSRTIGVSNEDKLKRIDEYLDVFGNY